MTVSAAPLAAPFAAESVQVFRVSPAATISLGDAKPLLAALAKPGKPFRIGGMGALQAGCGEFETLTSGSSGKPRHIRRTMQSWTASFAVNAGIFGIGPGVKLAVLGGLEQSLSLYGSVEALHLGADLHLLAGLRPDRQRRALADCGVEVVYATPAQLRMLVEAGTGVLPALRVIAIGGSKLDDTLRGRLAELAPAVAVFEFYGAAEASFITLSGPDDPPASVGRAYPGVEIDAPQGEPGEIWLRSPYLFAGYAGEDAGSARWRDGWLCLNELGWMQDGRLYLAGRAGRMVTVADHNVFPEVIETFLLGLPGVKRAAVLPRRDAKRGVHLVAFLQGDARQEAAVLAALRAHLGPLKSPKVLIWLQDWPQLPSGKTDLVTLAARLKS